MKVIAVIPARMGSSRFPGKPLAPILGKPMIEHVYRRTAMSQVLDDVYVATCDHEIREAVIDFGGHAIMTSSQHERASDRVAEAVAGSDADVIVMVQGDEPMVRPEMIDEAVAPFSTELGLACVNLKRRIEDEASYRDPNTIKVVTDRAGNALYMSRQPIPNLGKAAFPAIRAEKQVCIIPFSRNALRKFTQLLPTPLEIAESIDMMRFIEHGVPVRMVDTAFDTQAVDTEDDLRRVEAMMRDDTLTGSY